MNSDSDASYTSASLHPFQDISTPQVVSLLILQPSPFCNINCTYCYLPDRTSNHRMFMEILEAALQRLLEADLIQGELSIVWHAGEPLAVPLRWYRAAFELIRRIIPEDIFIYHAIQSNGTLLNDSWCDFIKENKISLGLSIDGPAELHDIYRKTRDGRGTHASAEESSDEAIQRFYKRLFFLQKQSGNTLKIREFEAARHKPKKFSKIWFNIKMRSIRKKTIAHQYASRDSNWDCIRGPGGSEPQLFRRHSRHTKNTHCF